MSTRSFGSKDGKISTSAKGAGPSGKSTEEIVRELKAGGKKKVGTDYRTQSLALHGNFCGHCGMEFVGKNLKLLTVHHKDSNSNNNPPDGSNWENLCVYCHDNVHSRGLLGDHNDGAKAGDNTERVHTDGPSKGGMGSFGDLFAAKLKGKG
jgi:hypothetical protein